MLSAWRTNARRAERHARAVGAPRHATRLPGCAVSGSSARAVARLFPSDRATGERAAGSIAAWRVGGRSRPQIRRTTRKSGRPRSIASWRHPRLGARWRPARSSITSTATTGTTTRQTLLFFRARQSTRALRTCSATLQSATPMQCFAASRAASRGDGRGTSGLLTWPP